MGPRRSLAALAAVACAFVAFARPAHADDSALERPHARVELIADAKTVRAGGATTFGLRFTIDPDWHLYWKNPGDAGDEPRVKWTLPSGAVVSSILWPAPTRLVDGDLGAYVYVRSVVLPVRVRWPESLPTGPVRVEADVSWLVCHEECIPGDARVALDLRAEAGAPVEDAASAAVLRDTLARLPKPLPAGVATATRDDGGWTLRLARGGPWDVADARVVFFPDEDVLHNAAPQRVARDPGGVTLRLAASKRPQALPNDLRGVMTVARGDERDAFALDTSQRAGAPPPSPVEETSLLAALALAFLGGLILNLMPCVLPVLVPKVLGFFERAGEDRAVARRHGFAYGAGVVAAFWALAGLVVALEAGGEAVGWGFQLQQPWVVALLTLLFVAMALNLFGVFEVGTSLTGLAARHRGHGLRAAFAGGVLATIVSTPCAAPFMATAVARAVAGTAFDAFAILTVLGLGLAAPFVLLTSFPAAVARMPRPGAWMQTLKRALAFPMLGVAVWFASIFGAQAGADGLVALAASAVGSAAALWVYGTWGTHSSAPAVRGIVGHGLAALLLAGSVAWAVRAALAADDAAEPTSAHAPQAGAPPPTSVADGWEPWSEARVAQALAQGRPVFVDFTAEWCLTCKATEKAVLSTDAVRDAIRRHDVVALRADWTRRDATITAALKGLGQASVPVHVVYSPSPGRAPNVLPTLISPAMVVSALEAAVPSDAGK